MKLEKGGTKHRLNISYNIKPLMQDRHKIDKIKEIIRNAKPTTPFEDISNNK